MKINSYEDLKKYAVELENAKRNLRLKAEREVSN